MRDDSEASTRSSDPCRLPYDARIQELIVLDAADEMAEGEIGTQGINTPVRQGEMAGIPVVEFNPVAVPARRDVPECAFECSWIDIDADNARGRSGGCSFDEQCSGATAGVQEDITRSRLGKQDHGMRQRSIECALHVANTPGPGGKRARRESNEDLPSCT